jgi:alkylation response protein AidB-like acyl-CoA dehydrogenase
MSQSSASPVASTGAVETADILVLRPAEPLVAIAARLSEGFFARAPEVDHAAAFPTANYDELRATDLFHMALPVEFGGRAASMLDVAQVLHELARGCPSTALIFNMHLALSGQLAHMWRSDPDGPWGLWLQKVADDHMLLGGALSESSSWNAAMFPQAKAVRVAGGYKVTGDRSFCTGSSELDLIQCTAQYTSENGEVRCIYFLMDSRSDGIAFKNDWNTLGMRASHSQGLRLEGLFVPSDEVLYDYAYGAIDFSQIWLSFLAWSFIGFASVYSGIAERARQYSVSLIAGRARVPGTHGLPHKASNQVRAAEMDVLNATMRSIREDVARRYPNGAPITIQTIIDTAVAKQVCVTKAPDVVDHAIAIVGGQAYFCKLPLERMLRDVRAAPFHPFSADDALELLGKFAFGIPFLEPGGWAL